MTDIQKRKEIFFQGDTRMIAKPTACELKHFIREGWISAYQVKIYQTTNSRFIQ